jgi:lysozyme family protein
LVVAVAIGRKVMDRDRAKRWINFLLDQIEGEYSDDPDDPGGQTAWGISRRYWPEMFEHGMPSREEAVDFYHYGPFKHVLRYASYIGNEELGYGVFDHAVNDGARDSVRLLQTGINECGYRLATPINVDGRFGPITLGACHVYDKYEERNGFNPLLIAFQALRACLYLERKPKYARGWLKRTRMAP